MLEVGDESHKEHQELLNFVDEFDWDGVYIIGQEYENCKIPKTMKYFKGTDEFIRQILAQSNPITGKTILLKNIF